MKIFYKSIVDDITLKQIFDESREKVDERADVGDVSLSDNFQPTSLLLKFTSVIAETV